MQEVAKLGWLPVDVGCTVEWQREQRGCEGLGCSKAEGSRPALDTCSYTRAAQQRWCGACAAARQKPNELSGLGAPAATKLEGEDNEAAARGAEKPGVRSEHNLISKGVRRCLIRSEQVTGGCMDKTLSFQQP